MNPYEPSLYKCDHTQRGRYRLRLRVYSLVTLAFSLGLLIGMLYAHITTFKKCTGKLPDMLPRFVNNLAQD